MKGGCKDLSSIYQQAESLWIPAGLSTRQFRVCLFREMRSVSEKKGDWATSRLLLYTGW